MEKQKSFLIFIDDERNPENATWLPEVAHKSYDTTYVCRTLDSLMLALKLAKTCLKAGWRLTISFDHDLGDIETLTANNLVKLLPSFYGNYDVESITPVVFDGTLAAKIVIEQFKCLCDSEKERVNYFVHSQNPIGAGNIKTIMQQYFKSA